MSQAWDDLKASNAWDASANLPLVPQHNNPSIYSAYAAKLVRNKLDDAEHTQLYAAYLDWADQCRVIGPRGLFNRYPDGRGGVTSHDELMGRAWWSVENAVDIDDYLDSTWGVYYNLGSLPLWKWPRFCIERFIWVRPFIKARAGRDISLFRQWLFAAHVLWSARKPPEPTAIGNYLRIWIMHNAAAYSKYPIMDAALSQWSAKMNEYDFWPRDAFKIYLAECPIFYQYACEL